MNAEVYNIQPSWRIGRTFAGILNSVVSWALKNGIMVHLVTLRDFNPQEVLNKGASVTFADVNKYQSVMLRYDSWLSKILYGLVIAKNNLKGFLALNQAAKEQKPNVCLIIGGNNNKLNIHFVDGSCFKNTIWAYNT